MQKFIFFIIITLIFSCENNSLNTNIKINQYFSCNVEKTIDDNIIDNKYSNIIYKGFNLRTNEVSHSGKYSIKLNKKQPFGLTVNLTNVQVNDYYEISVWRYSKNKEKSGVLVASMDGVKIYKSEKVSVETDANGWDKLEIKLRIPPFVNTAKLKVYVWQPDDSNVYFDDLEIKRIENKIPSKLDSLAIKIFIDNKDYNKLIDIRTNALNVGMLETGDDSWVKAMMFSKDDVFKIKLRLKGDWTDHIKGTKWSFRIKMKKDGAWRGMREFSIQDPETRFFQYEWLGHKIFEKEDVLSPRYGFVPVYINNSYVGIYAFEEHFLKQLPESKKRREGPILKLSETGFWTCNKLKLIEGEWYNLPIFESSAILAYKMDKTLSNNTLKKEFLIAQNLLFQHQFCNAKVSDLIDVNLAAKYYAIIDLTKMYHGMRWHNQRFYYNPITSKLEIIGYDGYTAEGVYDYVKRPIIGYLSADVMKNVKTEERINYDFFTDSIFLKKYVHYLKKYSNNEYINMIIDSFKNDIDFFEDELISEYPMYRFKKEFYFNNAKEIRENLPKYINEINSGDYYKVKYKKSPKNKVEHKMNNALPPEFVKVYTEQKQDSFIYTIKNFLAYDINTEALISSNKKNKSFYKVNKVKVSNFNSDNNQAKLTSEFAANVLIYKITGYDNEFYSEIYPWKAPENNSPRQKLLKENKFPQTNYYSIKDNLIIFNEGKITITEKIIIPQSYKVIIKEGTELDFVNNSFFISYSPVFIKGIKTKKVIIKSSDNTAKGFSVLQVNLRSKINYTEFINFNTLNYNGWTLTGAVNFYESDVDISNTLFKENLCEDALNIVRSNFRVDNCGFKNIFSDAFDSDFSTGILTKTKFNEIGNDAIDFSGSEVNISDCNIKGTGDKGISGGEKSTLTVKNCVISDVKIGIASKDKSYVKAENINLQNCYYGFVALQKKPEYGYAKIDAFNIKYSNVINLHLIEKKSTLYLNNKIIKGYDKNTAKKFY